MFGGNCGMFALALAKYIQKKYKDNPVIVMATGMDHDGSGNLSKENYKDLEVGDYDLYHIMVGIGQEVFGQLMLIDGSGIYDNWNYLDKFCLENYDNAVPAIAYIDFDPKNYQKVNTIIRQNTNWSISSEQFYEEILKIVKKSS